MFYLEGINDLKMRSLKPKEKSKKIVKTIKPNLSQMSLDSESTADQAAEIIFSKEAKKAIEEGIVNEEFQEELIDEFAKKSLENKCYIVSENIENKLNNLEDQLNNLAIDLKN